MAGFMARLFGDNSPKKRTEKRKHEAKPPIIVNEPAPAPTPVPVEFPEFPEIPDYMPEFEKLNGTIDSAKKETLEAIHQENVRVYRNVQAVIVDETGRIYTKLEKSNTSIRRKAVTSLVFSILAFSISVLIFAFLILDKAGLF